MSDEFKILSDREHVIKRSGVYIGSTIEEDQSGIINYTHQTKKIVPALIKCVEEAYQNCIDHHIKTKFEHAKNISIDISNDVDGTFVKVSDDGKGIPCTKIGDQYIPVVAWTTLRAGSNFDDSNRVGAGTNGMGIALVNIFSKAFIGTTDDGNKKIQIYCCDNMEQINVAPVKNSSGKTGTTVQFYPDLEKFGLETFTQDHIDVIEDRIANLAIMYPTINFTFCGKTFKFKNIKQIAKNFHPEAVSFEQENISFVFAPSGEDEEFRCLSYLNGIYIKNGGSHVEYVVDRVISNLREVIQKKHKISVLPNQIRQHLLFASWISNFNGPKFDSQTKERLTNSQSEISSVFASIDYDKIARQILNTPEIVDPMIAAILFKKELAEKKEQEKLKKELSKTNLRKIVNFTDASEKNNRRDCMLMITEGMSALSSVLSARTNLIGAYPLKGKPLNVYGLKNSEILANKEISELMSVTGLSLGQKICSPTDLRFGKIVILTDQDSDGGHLAGLLISMIKNLWPEIIELGMLYRFITPIVKVDIGKNVHFFYTLSDFEDWSSKNKNKKYTSRYLKGLGSSGAKDFEYFFNNMDKHLIKITKDDVKDFDMLDMVFGKQKGAADVRKTWLSLED